jgi:hypothetical protein
MTVLSSFKALEQNRDPVFSNQKLPQFAKTLGGAAVFLGEQSEYRGIRVAYSIFCRLVRHHCPFSIVVGTAKPVAINSWCKVRAAIDGFSQYNSLS